MAGNDNGREEQRNKRKTRKWKQGRTSYPDDEALADVEARPRRTIKSSHATAASSSLQTMAQDLAAGSGFPSGPGGLSLCPRNSHAPLTSPRCLQLRGRAEGAPVRKRRS